MQPDNKINLTHVNSSAADSNNTFVSANGLTFVQSNSNSRAGTRGQKGNAHVLNDPPKMAIGPLNALSPTKAGTQTNQMTRQQILAMALSN